VRAALNGVPRFGHAVFVAVKDCTAPVRGRSNGRKARSDGSELRSVPEADQFFLSIKSTMKRLSFDLAGVGIAMCPRNLEEFLYWDRVGK
jgi:hypothetical protein